MLGSSWQWTVNQMQLPWKWHDVETGPRYYMAPKADSVYMLLRLPLPKLKMNELEYESLDWLTVLMDWVWVREGDWWMYGDMLLKRMDCLGLFSLKECSWHVENNRLWVWWLSTKGRHKLRVFGLCDGCLVHFLPISHLIECWNGHVENHTNELIKLWPLCEFGIVFEVRQFTIVCVNKHLVACWQLRNGTESKNGVYRAHTLASCLPAACSTTRFFCLLPRVRSLRHTSKL